MQSGRGACVWLSVSSLTSALTSCLHSQYANSVCLQAQRSFHPHSSSTYCVPFGHSEGQYQACGHAWWQP